MPHLRTLALGLALCTGLLVGPPAGLAQPAAQPTAAAARDGSRDFDYWFGTWKEHSRRLLHPLTGSKDWVEMDGGSVVTKIWGGHANLVEFRGDGPNGRVELLSLRTYNPVARQWSVSFASPGVGALSAPAVGEFRNGRGDFYDQEPFNGHMILVRFSVRPITPDAMQSEQAFSDDGGKSWEVNWINRYTRVKTDAPPGALSQVVAAAVADPLRPATDTVRDADRKPLEVLAFAGIKPGDHVADYAAGSGYFTRLFADIVGPSGRVYASVPSGLYKYANIQKGMADIAAFSVGHPNVSLVFGEPLQVARYPEKLDLFSISQNYHDLKDRFMGPVNMAAFNKAVFDALKPGGIYLVADHVAAPGSPPDVTEALHRIEPAVVRREVEAAGFRFVGESRVLANPADPHTADPFDPSIRGRTDQFIYKFRKP
jgi:predicted methyltransferase